MLEALEKAVEMNSAALVLAVVAVFQFSVIVYMGKYLLYQTVSKDAFHDLASKIESILEVVRNTNTRIDEQNK